MSLVQHLQDRRDESAFEAFIGVPLNTDMTNLYQSLTLKSIFAKNRTSSPNKNKIQNYGHQEASVVHVDSEGAVGISHRVILIVSAGRLSISPP